MKVKFTVIEDTVTDYLKDIQKKVVDDGEHLVREATKTLAYAVSNQGEIWGTDDYGSFGLQWEGGAPYETGALINSGLNPNQQVFSKSDYKSIIDLYWTGMYADYSWREFRKDERQSEPPERDYAYFQETGIDITWTPSYEKVSPNFAKHKGFFTGMVKNKGVHEKIKYNVANEYMKLLLKR